MTHYAEMWNPRRPVKQGHKFLGSDGKFHLSECMLVELSVADGYHCTCLDWWD